MRPGRICFSPAFGAIRVHHHGGAVAQLGARLDGIEEVEGSNPFGSTKFARAARAADQKMERPRSCCALDQRVPVKPGRLRVRIPSALHQIRSERANLRPCISGI
jgi:hypothetical protein